MHHGSLQILVACVVGLSIPHPQASPFHLFMLAHFKPISPDFPLIEKKNKSINSTFNDFSFSEKSKLIVKNWEKSMSMRMKEAQTNCIKDLLWQRSLKLWLNVHILVIIDVSSEIMTAKKKN